MDVATVTSPVGLWTHVLKPRVRHFDRRHLGFLEPEVTIFGRECGAGEDLLASRQLAASHLSLKAATPLIMHNFKP